MDGFLKSKRLYMLFVLPFLVAAIALLGEYFPGAPIDTVEVRGCIDLDFIHSLDKVWLSVIGGVAMLGVAYAIFFINSVFKLFDQHTTLPSLIYVLLTSGIMVSHGFDHLLMAVFITALAVARLQSAICYTKSNRALFDFGALVMLAIFIYPKFVLLLAWALCVLFFSGRSTLKDIVALLLGQATLLFLLVFWCFWTDSLAALPDRFMESLRVGEYIHRLPVVELVRLGMLLPILLAALSRLSARYPVMTVSQRRGLLSLVSMLVFIVLTLLVVPGNYYDFMYLLALPLSFIYAHFFITNRQPLTGNLFFLLLLAACSLTYFI